MIVSSTVRILGAVGVGLAAGAHAAIWGVYKDAIHEGFSVLRFVRSMIVGPAAALAIAATCHQWPTSASTSFLLFGLTYASERILIELWKTFIRNEDQSKYTIPMQFSIRGVPVRSRTARMLAATAFVAAVVLCARAVTQLGPNDPTTWPRSAALCGLTAGLAIAAGGAWKDAPGEGFDIVKFCRSPIIAIACAILLSRLTSNLWMTGIAAAGLERGTAETYKTFFFPSRPRGKFAGKPVSHPEMLVRRRYFVPLYVAICAAVLLTGALALVQSEHETSSRQPASQEVKS